MSVIAYLQQLSLWGEEGALCRATLRAQLCPIASSRNLSAPWLSAFQSS